MKDNCTKCHQNLILYKTLPKLEGRIKELEGRLKIRGSSPANTLKLNSCDAYERKIETQAAELSEAKSSLEVLTKCDFMGIAKGLCHVHNCLGCRSRQRLDKAALDKREG